MEGRRNNQRKRWMTERKIINQKVEKSSVNHKKKRIRDVEKRREKKNERVDGMQKG